ncbi:MAG: FAD-dependent monooxygenase, partial [Verrucomicrobia bacterium]|nr:FAD-dependent monooxygenase [Verrucomicrobiota bacterium]
MTTDHIPVAIVGGGPCGLGLGLMLTRHGVPCAVFERHTGLSTHPKAMGISRRTSEILQQLGVFDALFQPCRHLIEEPGVCLTIFARSLIGEEWGRIPLTEPVSPLSPGPNFHCPQTLTEQVLHQALEAAAPGTVRFNAEVTGVAAEDSRVAFVAGGRPMTADWLVAADGAGGQIRHHLGVESDGPGDMGHFLNVFFRASYGSRLGGRRSLLFNVLSEDSLAFFVTVNGDDLWLMHHFLQPGEEPGSFSPADLGAMIRRASGMPEVPVEVLSVSPWVMSPKVSRRFRAGRVLLTGDASARMSPAGGLGLNTGLQSAHNLAWKLAEVVRGVASPALLDTYETERHGAALWTLEHTNRNALEIGGIVAAALQHDWADVRYRIAHNGRGGSWLGADLGIEYPEGALIPDDTQPVPRADPVNDYIPNARPGARAPHVDLGNGRSVLELFGSEFTLLAAGRLPDALPPVRSHAFPATSPFAAAYGLRDG